MVDDADLDEAEADEPAAVFALDEAERFAGERLVDVGLDAAMANRAVGAHAPDLLLGRIRRLAQHPVPAPRRGGIVLGRGIVAERRMRPLLVVDAPELTEAVELLAQAARRGCAVSRRSIRCSRSSRPFCCGLPGAMRSGRTPALITLTASRDNPPAPVEANGGPLSERSRTGRPYSRNAASSTGQTCSVSSRPSTWQRNR